MTMLTCGRSSVSRRRSRLAFTLPHGRVSPSFLDRVIELVGELWIQFLQDRKLPGHAVFVIEAGISQSEAVMRLRLHRFQPDRLFQGHDRVLILATLVTSISQTVEGVKIRLVQQGYRLERIGGLVELAGAK